MVVALPLLILVAPIVALALTGYGLGRAGAWRGGRQARLRTAAALLGAVAICVYALGMLCVALAVLDAEESPLRPCGPGHRVEMERVIDYSVDYLPLRFVCETTYGGDYTAEAVPGWVNPAAAVLALGAMSCVGTAVVEGERRARRGAVA